MIDEIFPDRVVAARRLRHQHLGADPVGAHDQDRTADALRNRHHPSEGSRLSPARRGAGPFDRPGDPLLGGFRAGEIDAGLGVTRAHSTGSAAGTWVRSPNAATRRSTAAWSTPSNPLTPNPWTANPPIAAPYTMARRRCAGDMESAWARYPMNPPANASPAP